MSKNYFWALRKNLQNIAKSPLKCTPNESTVWNCHSQHFLEHSIRPQSFVMPLWRQSLSLYHLILQLLDLLSGIPYKWKDVTVSLFAPGFFHLAYHLRVIHTVTGIIYFHCWVTSHWMDMPHLSSPRWRGPRVLWMKLCLFTHTFLCACTFYYFSWMNTQEWNHWAIVSTGFLVFLLLFFFFLRN